jgi:uncharacterized SAM-binding protein YcdF (DUF218 family)
MKAARTEGRRPSTNEGMRHAGSTGKRHKSRPLRLAIAVVGLIFGWLLVLGWEVLRYAETRDGESAAAAIVLGAGVSGNEPSPVFAARIDHGMDLYRTGRVRRILFTGGVTPGNERAESEVARDYAVRRGIPEGDTACETVSRVTRTNLTEAQGLLADPRDRVLVVSDPLHMRRAVTMARDIGLDAHPAPTPYSRYRSWNSRAAFLSREVFFYAGYFLFERWKGRRNSATSAHETRLVRVKHRGA